MAEKHVFLTLTEQELRTDSEWWNLYNSSFPSEEREMPEVILSSLQQDAGMVFRISSESHTIGIATCHLLKDPPAVFLVYLALSCDHQGKGLGTAFMEYVFNEGQSRLTQLGLQSVGSVWEVERPDESDDAEEQDKRKKRIAFFTKNGGQLLPLSYTQPPVDGIHTVPMHLMYKGKLAPDKELGRKLVMAVLDEKYGKLNGVDSIVLHRIKASISEI